MSEHTPSPGLAQIALELLPDSRDGAILLVCKRSQAGGRFPGRPLEVVERAEDIDSIVVESRFAVAVIAADSLFVKDPAGLTRAIAALRDRLALRILVLDKSGVLALSDYFALGFERWPSSNDGYYLFDADADSRQREWNNSTNWANPENFNKYRW